jgi:hypothetical protein
MKWSKQIDHSKGSITPHKIKTEKPLVVEPRKSPHI